jgi:hypothetical protein
MKTAYTIVQGQECYFEITEMLEREIKISFKSEIVDGVIFFTEDFSLVNTSNLLVVVRIQKINGKNDTCEVEVVSGGGGDGWLSFTFGNEKRRVNKVMGLIHDFSVANGFNIATIAKSR